MMVRWRRSPPALPSPPFRPPESHPRAPLNNVGYNAGEQVTPTPPSAGPPIGPSAKAHGISDQRIWEAYRNPVAEFVLRNGVTIRLGYDSQANLLEIGWIDRGRGRRIIHAMVCRAAWRREYGLP
jgi:YD repeat-containing protein